MLHCNDISEKSKSMFVIFSSFVLKQLPVKCVLVKNLMEVSGGGLEHDYTILQFHFHWGDTSDTSEGSEHTVNSIRYPMEVVTKIKLFFYVCLYFIPLILFLVQMHIVSKRKDLTLDQALQAPDGLAVLGFFIEVKLGQVKLLTIL